MGILNPIQLLVAMVNGLVQMDIYLPINERVDKEQKTGFANQPNFPAVTGDLSNMEGNAKDDEDNVLGNHSEGIMMFTLHNDFPVVAGSRFVMIVDQKGNFIPPGARKAWRIKRITPDGTDNKLRLDPEEGLV